jgi:hypothetical protein
MDNPDLPQLIVDTLFDSGILSVAGSTLGGVLAPVLDRTLGDSTRWCLIVILCSAPGSPPLLPLMKRDISLTTYIVAWHLGLLYIPVLTDSSGREPMTTFSIAWPSWNGSCAPSFYHGSLARVSRCSGHTASSPRQSQPSFWEPGRCCLIARPRRG